MMSTLRAMKENKLPTWQKGMSWEDYETKYLSCVATRADGYNAITGGILKDLRDDNLLETALLDGDTRERMMKENDRAYNDLISTLPPGRWLRTVKESRSEEYGDKCAASAWEALKEIIKEEVDLDERDLKNKFEKSTKFGITKNPVEYLLKLEDIRDELRQIHNVEKTKGDIIEQILRFYMKSTKLWLIHWRVQLMI